MTIPLGRRFWLLAAAWLALVAFGYCVGTAHAEEPTYNATDSRQAIAEAAATYGVSEAWLLATARCEATLDPYAVGDHGHSFGLAQLNDRPTGLLAHFHAQGYGSAFDPYASATYMARAFAGEFAGEGITYRRWSCA